MLPLARTPCAPSRPAASAAVAAEAEAPAGAAVVAGDLHARQSGENGSALELAELELDVLRSELRRAEENELRRIEGRRLHARRNSGRISRVEPHITARSSTEFLELLGEPRRIRSPLPLVFCNLKNPALKHWMRHDLKH